MLPKSPIKALQLILLLGLVSLLLGSALEIGMDARALLVLGAAVVIVILWDRLKLHDYFFGDDR